MNRPFYADFVKHCMRFYARYVQKPTFKTDADKYNMSLAGDSR